MEANIIVLRVNMCSVCMYELLLLLQECSQSLVVTFKLGDFLVLLGSFIARVGVLCPMRNLFLHVGEHASNDRNETGKSGLQICVMNQLTFGLERKYICYDTWTYPAPI